jgi:two-component system, response regulator PdtaR
MPDPGPHGPRIVVADDDDLVRAMVVDVLTDAGFDVLEAGDAQEALRILKTKDDVLVLFTDINMPGDMNGIELAERVRHLWPKLSVVIGSGGPVPSAIPPTSTFWSKPYDFDVLADRIRKMITPD